jgi:HNH endonuclease
VAPFARDLGYDGQPFCWAEECRALVRAELNDGLLGGGRCPLTGITDPAFCAHLIIIPWSDCDDAQRLDAHNGLLLSALWDAGFDQGLVSFVDDGTPLGSPKLSPIARTGLGP